MGQTQGHHPNSSDDEEEDEEEEREEEEEEEEEDGRDFVVGVKGEEDVKRVGMRVLVRAAGLPPSSMQQQVAIHRVRRQKRLRRLRIGQEILSTEHTYVSSLLTLHEVFDLPLRQVHIRHTHPHPHPHPHPPTHKELSCRLSYLANFFFAGDRVGLCIAKSSIGSSNISTKSSLFIWESFAK